MAYIISVPDSPASTQRITIEGLTYFIYLAYNSRQESWELTLHNEDNEPLVEGIKLIPDQNITKRFLWVDRFEGDIVISIYNATAEPITRDNLGTDYLIVYVTKEELDEIESN